jgi:hypothetical protein
MELTPVSGVDIGFGYQKWFYKEDWEGYLSGAIQSQADQQDQSHADIRVSLPVWNINGTLLTQSLYAQEASLINDTTVGTLVVGWQGQFNLGEQYLRWIVEMKHLSNDAKQQWRNMVADRRIMVGLHHDLAINNIDIGEAKAIQLLWVMPNDWELILQGQRYLDVDDNQLNQITFYINLPLDDSRLILGSDYTPDSTVLQDQWNYWGVWEFRF